MKKGRKLKFDKNFMPVPTFEGDEIYNNGVFNFNITCIIEHIDSGKIQAEKETVNVQGWFKSHFHASVNEEHLQIVDISKPVIQAEIRPGVYEIIDGNHRMERACREGTEFVDSYKLKGEQLLPYFADVRGYRVFIEYWNSKL